MNDFEKCKKHRNSIQELRGKILKLKEEIAEKNKAQRTLDEDALKAEILEEKNWEKKKEEAEKNREEIAMLRSEIEKQEKAIEILKEKAMEFSGKAIQ